MVDTLPYRPPDAPFFTTGQERPDTPEVGRRKKIMVVDDDSDSMELAAALLGPKPLLTAFGNGEEAVAALNNGYRPDCVVTDIDLRNGGLMTGIDVIAEINKLRDQDKTWKPTIIICSCNDEQAIRERYSGGRTLDSLGVTRALKRPDQIMDLVEIGRG